MYSNPLKDKACRAFSKYIRLRDSVATTGTTGWCRCITCGHKTHSSLIDAGHCLKGRHNAILFDERATNGQCQYCNRTLGGNYDMYKIAMIKKYGDEVYNEIVDLNKTTVKFSCCDYSEKTDFYLKKVSLILDTYKQ